MMLGLDLGELVQNVLGQNEKKPNSERAAKAEYQDMEETDHSTSSSEEPPVPAMKLNPLAPHEGVSPKESGRMIYLPIELSGDKQLDPQEAIHQAVKKLLSSEDDKDANENEIDKLIRKEIQQQMRQLAIESTMGQSANSLSMSQVFSSKEEWSLLQHPRPAEGRNSSRRRSMHARGSKSTGLERTERQSRTIPAKVERSERQSRILPAKKERAERHSLVIPAIQEASERQPRTMPALSRRHTTDERKVNNSMSNLGCRNDGDKELPSRRNTVASLKGRRAANTATNNTSGSDEMGDSTRGNLLEASTHHHKNPLSRGGDHNTGKSAQEEDASRNSKPKYGYLGSRLFQRAMDDSSLKNNDPMESSSKTSHQRKIPTPSTSAANNVDLNKAKSTHIGKRLSLDASAHELKGKSTHTKRNASLNASKNEEFAVEKKERGRPNDSISEATGHGKDGTRSKSRARRSRARSKSRGPRTSTKIRKPKESPEESTSGICKNEGDEQTPPMEEASSKRDCARRARSKSASAAARSRVRAKNRRESAQQAPTDEDQPSRPRHRSKSASARPRNRDNGGEDRRPRRRSSLTGSTSTGNTSTLATRRQRRQTYLNDAQKNAESVSTLPTVSTHENSPLGGPRGAPSIDAQRRRVNADREQERESSVRAGRSSSGDAGDSLNVSTHSEVSKQSLLSGRKPRKTKNSDTWEKRQARKILSDAFQDMPSLH